MPAEKKLGSYACPNCGSANTYLAGKTRAGSRRVTCRACKKTRALNILKCGVKPKGDRAMTDRERSANWRARHTPEKKAEVSLKRRSRHFRSHFCCGDRVAVLNENGRILRLADDGQLIPALGRWREPVDAPHKTGTVEGTSPNLLIQLDDGERLERSLEIEDSI